MKLEEYNKMQEKLTEIFYENKKFYKGKELFKFKKDILYVKKSIKHEFDREKTGIYDL